MEASSPDVRVSSPKGPKRTESDNVSNAPSSIRFLISNSAAGSVIGKGGATISDYQVQSGARIILSRNHEYFPGTTDRIILLIGTVGQVLTAFHLILTKVLNEGDDGHEGHEPKTNLIRLIVRNNMCGAIIGKRGATIKNLYPQSAANQVGGVFVKDSGANIKLSSQDQPIPGVTDRLISITGSLDQQLRAVALIITKLSEYLNYVQYATAPISYGSGLLGLQGLQDRFAATSISPDGYGGSSGVSSPHSKGIIPPLGTLRSKVHVTLPVVEAGPVMTSLTVAVPDERIGVIVGRGGKTITEMQQASGAKIKISDRGDFVTGTTNRKVAISGTAQGVRTAQILLTEKVR